MKLIHHFITLTLILPWLWNGTFLPTAQAANPLAAPAVAPGQVPEGLNAAEWVAIQEQMRQAEYHYTWHQPSATYVAPNPVHGWHIALGANGLHVRPSVDQAEAGWELQLRLTAWGYAGQPQLVTGEPVPHAEDGRVTYQWDDALTEWYVNDERGLEQGFTIAHPPIPSLPDESLVLELALATDLYPHLTMDDQAVLFADAGGQTVLRYADLYVTDATGQVLPARLEMDMFHVSRFTNHALRIVIDDAGAVYPLTVDPLLASQVAKLIADDGGAGDVFGQPVLISEDTLVIGAHRADVGGNDEQGTVYVFERNRGGTDNWGQVAKLTASDGTAGDYFGCAVSLSGDTVVVGAYQDDGNRGSAHVFERNQGGVDNWGQVKKLIADDGAAGNWFGLDVSVDGDTTVVGARYAESNQGAAYIFYRNQGGADNWGQVKKLTADDGAAGDIFGHRVSVSEDTMVITAALANIGGRSEQGAAYVFYRDQGGIDNWGQVAKLVASDGGALDHFGSSVSIIENMTLIGSPLADVGGNDDQGASYVFYRHQGGVDAWGQVTKLTASDGAASDHFGISTALGSDAAVVGARYADVGGNDNQGAAYIFYYWGEGRTDNWDQIAKVTANDGTEGDWFGRSVKIDGETVVVGAPHTDVGGNEHQGTAYVFRLDHQVYLPLVLRNYKPPIGFPLRIGDPIPIRPVAHQGEVFYTKVLRMPEELPTGGNFYFSSQPNVVAEVLVDDELAILSGGVEVYSYNFSPGGSPTPAILEAPRSMMEQLAEKTITVEYRDVYGSFVEASDMWLIWVP